jgi:hypothetical protein
MILTRSDDTARVLDEERKASWSLQIEELFCDYAAAWFFGPMYLQSFADEMSYHSAQGSDTHPSGHVRSRMLLYTNSSHAACRGYKAVSLYAKLKSSDATHAPSEEALKQWGRKFAKALGNIGLEKYRFVDRSGLIVRFFEANIPFVTLDVRDLINNLPENRFDSKPLERYSDLVSESLRKMNLLRLAKDFVREPELLFSIPPPLAKSPSEGRA